MTTRWRSAATAIVMTCALALAGCSGSTKPDPTATPSAQETAPASAAPEESAGAEAALDRDPALAALLDELLVEELPPLSLRTSDSIAADCGTEAGGCYDAAGAAIVVTSEWTDFRRPELLAHEYLHYVWERDGLGDDDELVAALDAAFADAEGLGAIVPPWQQDYVEADGTIMPTELFSYACTGLRAEQLATPIAERCQQYLQLDALPVAQSISAGSLLEAVSALREAEGLQPLESNPHAAAASDARAALFTPYAQVPLDEYPASVRTHLDAGCESARYGARLTRATDPEQMVQALDALLDGALTSSQYSGIGIATAEFDYIDASELFGDRVLRVNASLIVTTVCA